MNALLKRIFSPTARLRVKEGEAPLPNDLSLYQRTLQVAWPSALEGVLVSLVSSFDSMMVGTIGPEAITAVGITNQPKFIFLAFIFALNMGVTAVVARRRGQNDQDGARQTLRQAVMICTILGVVLTLVSMVVAKPLIKFAGAGDDVLDMATGYFRIIMAGFIFNALSMTINAAQRGCGKTRISMVTNVTANIVNVIFNYLLIGGKFGFPKLGVAGAAIATSLGFFVAFCMSLYSVCHKGEFLYLDFKGKWSFSKDILSPIMKVTSSSAIEQVFLRIGFFINSMMVAGLGTYGFATHQIGMNVLNLSFTFGDGFGTAASALSGQSLGQKRPTLASAYVKCAQRITLMISAVLSVVFIFGRHIIYGFFTKDQAIIATGGIIMCLIAATTFFQTSQVVIGGCLRGSGDTKFTAFVSFLCVGFVRPFTTWLFCYPLGFGVVGAWISLILDQLVRLSLVYWRFKSNKWQQIKL